MSFIDYFRRYKRRCRKLKVPKEVCYLRFIEEKSFRSKMVGTTNRGELVILDFNSKNQITGIELVGLAGSKPCQRVPVSWDEYDKVYKKLKGANR